MEELADVANQQVGLLNRGEVAAAIELSEELHLFGVARRVPRTARAAG